MTDADVFGKLSRIFETHAFSKDDELNDFLDDFDPVSTSSGFEQTRSPKKKQGTQVLLPDRPTPFDVWQQRNAKNMTKQKSTPTLNGQQWDRLVDKMHQSSRVKQSAMIKEQNQGLAMELGGFQFKPRINKHSVNLSATMKSLNERMPGILTEREKIQEHKVKEAADAEVADCSFSPMRFGSKVSDQYLRRMGREKVTPEDFFRYEAEKQRRIDVRKTIVTEIEDRELTFRPQLGEKSLKLQERLVQRGAVDIDPITRTTIVIATPNPKDRSRLVRSGQTPLSSTNRATGSFFAADDEASEYFEGPMLLVESEHPYRHNTNEYTTVQIPNAVSYSVSFSEDTRTECIYDYIKFYDDDTHTEYFGAGKYSGGTNNSSCNWPGVNGRPPLIIVAPRFIIHFRTNNSLNDFGFCMHIVPTLTNVVAPRDNKGLFTSFATLSPNGKNPHAPSEDDRNSTPNIPQISSTGRNYNIANATNYTKNRQKNTSVRVHERLYQHAMDKTTDYHNAQVDLMQNKLNIALKPWETVRGSREGPLGVETSNSFIANNSRTHLPKATLSEAVEELLLPESDDYHLDSPWQPHGADNGSSRLSVHQLNTAGMLKTGTSVNNVSLIKGVPVAVVEFDDLYAGLWKQLRTL